MAEAFLVEPKETKNENLILKQGAFQDLAEKGRSWTDVFQLVVGCEDRVVWTGPECALISPATSDPPDGHEYSVEIIVVSRPKEKKQMLLVTGTNARSTASTINGLLYLCSSLDSQNEMDVTLKCFAATPRQLLGTLEMLPKERHISCLRLQFVELDRPSCQALLASNIAHLELRQCTMDGLDSALQQKGGPKKRQQQLTISCTVPEFAKLAGGFQTHCPITEFKLQVHVWLQGDAPYWKAFTTALSTNTFMEQLTIEYLDISDEGWGLVCESLQNHPALHTLSLGFTEKFVDNYRRLTAERRTTRTEAVLRLVQSNKNICNMSWPDFQQDESIQSQVQACLDQNNNNRDDNNNNNS